MKKSIRFAQLFILFIITLVISLTAVEFIFRRYPQLLNQNKNAWFESKMRKALVEKVQGRIYRNWSAQINEVPNAFYQPWLVYYNADFENQHRLDEIVNKVKFKPDSHWAVPNVFRNSEEKDAIFYEVNTNSLGFRDSQREIAKNKETFRIIVLGSYVTFGYGLNEQDTYVRRLEKKLNEINLNHKKYEVWNWGRQGTTSIMGYALLVKEVMKYNPDLVIFDYGWADLYTNKDSAIGTSSNDTELNLFSVIKKAKSLLTNVCYFNSVTSPILDSSELCFRGIESLGRKNKDDAIAGWKESLKHATDFVIKNKIPFLMLKLNPQMPEDLYKEFSDTKNKVYFLDVMPYIYNQPIEKSEVEKFWAKKNWLNEINVTRKETENDKSVYIRNDAIQYSALAHRFISDRVFQEVKNLIEDQKLK